MEMVDTMVKNKTEHSSLFLMHIFTLELFASCVVHFSAINPSCSLLSRLELQIFNLQSNAEGRYVNKK